MEQDPEKYSPVSLIPRHSVDTTKLDISIPLLFSVNHSIPVHISFPDYFWQFTHLPCSDISVIKISYPHLTSEL